jgi:gentisate 1,2-dioxygenase
MTTESAAQARQDFYHRIDQQNMTPLWEVLGALVPKAPNSPLQAALWRYAEVRGRVMEAGRLITAAEAERRVLILENRPCAGIPRSRNRCTPASS